MEEVRVAALSMPKAIEDRPIGEEIVVYRIFDNKVPIFTMISEEKSILNVRVSSDFFEISDTIDGITPLRIWKNWISVDLKTVRRKQEVKDLVYESWYEVAENLSRGKRKLLNLEYPRGPPEKCSGVTSYYASNCPLALQSYKELPLHHLSNRGLLTEATSSNIVPLGGARYDIFPKPSSGDLAAPNNSQPSPRNLSVSALTSPTQTPK